MTKEEVFAAWAPDDSPWSSWAKPVLFAHLERAQSITLPASLPVAFPNASEKVALVVDLPGPEGVAAGLALAKIGYRPVPLYNAMPAPDWIGAPNPGTGTPWGVVSIVPIVSALSPGAEILASLQIRPDAPPAFLLDANRRGEWRSVLPGQFDNRSVSFPTDFPSAETLSSHGIRSVLLVQREWLIPQADLEPTLLRWQDDNIPLERLLYEPGAQREHLILKKPPWFRSLISALFSLTNPRPTDGSFGVWTSAGG